MERGSETPLVLHRHQETAVTPAAFAAAPGPPRADSICLSLVVVSMAEILHRVILPVKTSVDMVLAWTLVRT